MELITVRDLPFETGDGQSNMAADETLLVTAAAGEASFRLYGWSECTLSLGYFQAHASREQNQLLPKLPYVRRPSGGLTLVHHHEVTYSLALPQSAQQGLPPAVWLEKMHHAVASTLGELGVVAKLAEADGPKSEDCLCFKHITKADLTIDGEKVVGSAQRRLRGALLQHGAVLLSQSPATPSLPGIQELTGVSISQEEFCEMFRRVLRREMSWRFVEDAWTEEERQFTLKSIRDKYSRPRWNNKR